MTQNQIAYAKLREEKRHNQATESMANLELKETSRHNVSNEGISWYSASEGARHNLAQEDLNWYTAQRQSDLWASQASNQRAQSRYNDVRADYEPLRYSIERDLADLEDWKIIHQISQNERDLDLRERKINAEVDKIMTDIDDILLRYEFDVQKWHSTGRYREMAATIRDLVSAGNGVADITKKLTDMVVDAFGASSYGSK